MEGAMNVITNENGLARNNMVSAKLKDSDQEVLSDRVGARITTLRNENDFVGVSFIIYP